MCAPADTNVTSPLTATITPVVSLHSCICDEGYLGAQCETVGAPVPSAIAGSDLLESSASLLLPGSSR